MKQSKEQVVKIALQVMKDIDWPYDRSKGVRALFTSVEEQYEKYKTFEGFEKNKHKISAYWEALFDFPEVEGWEGRNIIWVLIKDDNGEPYEIGHRQSKFKILKNSKGKYYTEK